MTELAYRLELLDCDGVPAPGSAYVHMSREPVVLGMRIRLPVDGFEEWEVVRGVPPDRP
jgi:hypothetical protein